VSQQTRVFTVDSRTASRLEARLRDELPPDADWRTAPHARFQVRVQGVVLTCYESGKVVVQGRDLDTFAGRFLDDLEPVQRAERDGGTPAFDAPTIASDEAGKGDYFGPLVVAAVHADPTSARTLREMRVADSKTLSDERARQLAGAIEKALDHELAVLEPEDYNRAHAAAGNLNVVLADLHGRAIAALARRNPDAEVVVVDRFGSEHYVADALRAEGVTVPRLVQVVRAERHPAVAAASILARAGFLDGLAACSDACGTDLHKGAGAPVDRCARRVFEIGGRELLGKVAKLHFKNTAKIGGTAR
jgi:ribonuclease HIII